jgi:23S rRNA (cytosine1962-C5)-methyltransferase
MASIICLKARAHVTPVDLSKKALDWASQNFELNGVAALPLRLIREDALDFVDREVRRNKKYDIIICDPPSFSRITPKKTWQLEEIMLPMMENLAKLLDPKRGALFFTSHHSDLSGPLVSNVLLDLFAGKKLETDSLALSIRESGSPRLLPAGNLISCVLS